MTAPATCLKYAFYKQYEDKQKTPIPIVNGPVTLSVYPVPQHTMETMVKAKEIILPERNCVGPCAI